MKHARMRWWMAILVLCAAAPLARGQVELRLKIPSSIFLEMEPAVATLEIHNRTGEALRLGGESPTALLRLDIQRGSGEFVRPSEIPLVEEPVEIPPRGRRTLTLDMPQHYLMHRPGPHSVVACLDIEGELIHSERFLFDVVPGFELRRIEARVRAGEGEGAGRRHVLSFRSLARDREEWLFARFDEPAAGLCHGVYLLGPVLRAFEPQVEIDHDNLVHVLHQSAPQRFTHSVFALDGAPVSVRYYGGRISDARLETDDEGMVSPVGVVPYEGDPSAAPLRALTRVWDPSAPVATPPRSRSPRKSGSSSTPRAPPEPAPESAP
jgi:hypothetical protein